MNEFIVTPLGTVSPYPKDDKNCPGFLIEYNKYKVLLDSGEGVSRLLNLPNDLENLIVIISHLHKDHYSGLSSIAYASYVYKNLGYIDKKIKVYIPKGDIVEVEKYYSNEDSWGTTKEKQNLIDFEYLMNYGKENNLEFIPYDDNDIINLDKLKILFEENPHQLITYSIKLTDGNNTIVYSSDTGYNNNCLEKFAKDADLLICESTFLKGQNNTGNNHLYASDAGKIAKLASF